MKTYRIDFCDDIHLFKRIYKEFESEQQAREWALHCKERPDCVNYVEVMAVV